MDFIFVSAAIVVCTVNMVYGQYSTTKADSTHAVDVNEIIRKVFKKSQNGQPANPGGLAILPSFGYNPSLGFVIGGKITAGKQFGNQANTGYSIFGVDALYTSKGIITVQARHNIFTKGDKFNWQGNWQVSRFALIDYGIGTGNGKYQSNSFEINDYPVSNSDSAFPLEFTFIRFSEKVYKKIAPHLFAGVGVSVNIRSDIRDEKLSDSLTTPHQEYSLQHGFNPKKYSANGLVLALQYNTREHPARSRGGIYADISLQINQQWMGSSKNAVQLHYDFRKYWSLSSRNPEHVLAIWHLASYKLSGVLPYLELPATGYDTYARSGRGYTIGRFKGPSFAYFETEYRFPITRNKLISGVCFFNMQSASDGAKQGIFSSWNEAAGAGIRVLFQKQSRTALCMDFAKGNYGSSGIFFGLNEAF